MEHLSQLEQAIRDYAATEQQGFTVVMAADGTVWLIDRFGRKNVMDAVKGLVMKGLAEPVGLPKPTMKAPGEALQLFRLLG
jgi:hypothetical protein